MRHRITLVDILAMAVVAIGVAVLLTACESPNAGREAYQDNLERECRAWSAAAARATGNQTEYLRLSAGAIDCWRQATDSAARAAATSRRPVAIQMPNEAPSWQPSAQVSRSPAAPDPMPLPHVGAQTPHRGPMTWGETPFDVPPIMRDVPVQEFPWLAH